MTTNTTSIDTDLFLVIMATLEMIRDETENPTINHLETGFRHTPLTEKEITDRLKDTCVSVHHMASHVVKLIEQTNPN